ncbi:MAG: AAA family ATPase [Roseburia sp.]|nr:AAA family ATPase [Roseburia sp.]MCM1280110.1 AAA family ATPase [Robinsoniella sp.]
MAEIKEEYDFILIDNASANDVLTVNSMFASELVLVLVRVEGFSYKDLWEKIGENKKNHYPKEKMESLQESILQFGLQQNLSVIYLTEDDSFVLEAGHRDELKKNSDCSVTSNKEILDKYGMYEIIQKIL